MTFVFIRHGQYAHAPDGASNDRCPLTDYGRQSARIAGAFLKAAGITPDLVVTTKKWRTQETATLALEALGATPARIDNEAGARSLVELEAKLRDWTSRAARPVETVVLVGSGPTQEFCLARLGRATIPNENHAVVLVYERGANGGWSLTTHHPGTPPA